MDKFVTCAVGHKNLTAESKNNESETELEITSLSTSDIAQNPDNNIPTTSIHSDSITQKKPMAI